MIWRADTSRYSDSLRRIIAAIEQGVCVLLVMTAISGSCAADRKSSSLKTRDIEKYRQIAHRIFDRIIALKDRYSHLASIDNAARTEDAKDKLWIAYHYTHGMSWIPNPHYDPQKKGSRELKSFSAKDGIELNLYFYQGDWMGQAAVRPVHIGEMNVVTFIDGAETASVRALRRDIGQIVADEMNRFNNQHQDEQALHDAQK